MLLLFTTIYHFLSRIGYFNISLSNFICPFWALNFLRIYIYGCANCSPRILTAYLLILYSPSYSFSYDIFLFDYIIRFYAVFWVLVAKSRIKNGFFLCYSEKPTNDSNYGTKYIYYYSIFLFFFFRAITNGCFNDYILTSY